MELRDYGRIVLKWWIVLVALVVVGALAGYGLSKLTPQTYLASSSLLVKVATASTSAELTQGSTFIQNLMPTYTALATSAEVLEPVIDELGLEQSASSLANRISAENPLNTVIVTISARSGTSQDAADLAEAVTASLGTAIEEQTPALSVPIQDDDDSPPVIVTVPVVGVSLLTPDPAPKSPISPVTLYYVAGGALIGLVLGVIVALAINAQRARTRKTEASPA